MKHDLYEMVHKSPVKEVLDELREIIHDKGGAGVTIQGNRLTVRWGKTLKTVHAVIIEVDDGIDGFECPTCKNLDVYADDVAECWACVTCGWHDVEPPDHAKGGKVYSPK